MSWLRLGVQTLCRGWGSPGEGFAVLPNGSERSSSSASIDRLRGVRLVPSAGLGSISYF